MAVGMVKQLGLMNWLWPSPALGLHVSIGLRLISLVPRSETLLILKSVPGTFAPFRFIPKFTLLLMLKPERLGPLCHCVMPESCHPPRTPFASLLLNGSPNSMEYAALKMCARLAGCTP